MDLHVWSYPPRRSYIFQVSSKSIQGFQSPRGSKFALSHYFGYWLLQRLVLLYQPWHIKPNVHASVCSLFLIHYQFWADLHNIWHVASLHPTDGHGVLASTAQTSALVLRMPQRCGSSGRQQIERCRHENMAPHEQGVTECRIHKNAPLVTALFNTSLI